MNTADIPPSPAEDTEPPPSPPPTEEAAPPPRTYRTLYRDPNGPLGGVATGLANHFGFDPTIAQVGFVLTTLFGGSGLLFYLAAWFLIPSHPSAQGPSQSPPAAPSRPGLFAVILGTIALITGMGLLFGGLGLGFGFGGEQFVWLLILGAGLYLLTQRPQSLATFTDRVEGIVRPTQPWATPRTTAEDAAFAAPVAPPVVQAPKPPRPPITSVSLAIAAVVVGVLVALNELTGLRINPEAVFGSVVAICGIGLLIGSIAGRAWGLIPIGLIAAVGIGVSQIDDVTLNESFGEQLIVINSEDELVRDHNYRLAAGELRLSFQDLVLTEDRSISLDLGAGALVIEVPRDIAVDISADARFGEVIVFGEEHSGTEVSVQHQYRPEPSDESDDETGDVLVLTIDAETTFGEIEIYHVD